MKRKASLLLAVALFTGLTSATTVITPEEFNPDNITDSELDAIKQVYNNNTAELPRFVKSLVGDQDINLHFEDKEYRISMDNARIEEFEEGRWESPTLAIWMDRSDIEDIEEAERPGETVKEKLENGEIKYREFGFVNRVKFSVFRLLF